MQVAASRRIEVVVQGREDDVVPDEAVVADRDAALVLEGAAGDAPLGATVTIRIPDDSLAKIVAVPLGAIADKGATSGVWLIDQSTSTVTFRPVTLAGLGEETALIKQGLAVGDQVVALGAHLLHEGESVRAAGTETASR